MSYDIFYKEISLRNITERYFRNIIEKAKISLLTLLEK